MSSGVIPSIHAPPDEKGNRNFCQHTQIAMHHGIIVAIRDEPSPALKSAQ
jgi:hypothetical protein